jgi:hypothetical protein
MKCYRSSFHHLLVPCLTSWICMIALNLFSQIRFILKNKYIFELRDLKMLWWRMLGRTRFFLLARRLMTLLGLAWGKYFTKSFWIFYLNKRFIPIFLDMLRINKNSYWPRHKKYQSNYNNREIFFLLKHHS